MYLFIFYITAREAGVTVWNIEDIENQKKNRKAQKRTSEIYLFNRYDNFKK